MECPQEALALETDRLSLLAPGRNFWLLLLAVWSLVSEKLLAPVVLAMSEGSLKSQVERKFIQEALPQLLNTPFMLPLGRGPTRTGSGNAVELSTSTVQTVKVTVPFTPASDLTASSHKNLKCHSCC